VAANSPYRAISRYLSFAGVGRVPQEQEKMAGRGASFGAATIIVATICSMLAFAPAVAENVPLPTPAPRPKTGVAPPPQDTAPPAQQDSGLGHFFPFSFL
jgi:hypothetical protein